MLKVNIWFEPSKMHEIYNGSFCFNFKTKSFFVFTKGLSPENSVCAELKCEYKDGVEIKLSNEDTRTLREMCLGGLLLTEALADRMVYNQKDKSLYVTDGDFVKLDSWAQKKLQIEE